MTLFFRKGRPMVQQENIDSLKLDMRPVNKPGRGMPYEGDFLDFLIDPEKFYLTAPINKKMYKRTIDGVHQHIEEIECFIRTLWLKEDSDNSYPVPSDTLLAYIDELFNTNIILPDSTSYDGGKEMSSGTYKSYRSKINNSYRFFYNYKYQKGENYHG